ncbi:hypothetical protein NN561_017985 [Cricetulus griseus]
MGECGPADVCSRPAGRVADPGGSEGAARGGGRACPGEGLAGAGWTPASAPGAGCSCPALAPAPSLRRPSLREEKASAWRGPNSRSEMDSGEQRSSRASGRECLASKGLSWRTGLGRASWTLGVPLLPPSGPASDCLESLGPQEVTEPPPPTSGAEGGSS